MRFKSAASLDFQVFAVSGINTVSFGIQASDSGKQGLLGFAVERHDPTENERYIMPGFKVFPSIIPHPDKDTVVSTWEHPVQSFVWDDFTAKPGRRYEYTFQPIRGKPKNLDRTAPPIQITVETEPLFSTKSHDVFFNRGVASSQAYRRKFGNQPPDKQPTKQKQEQALQWLTRDLDEAIIKFIRAAKPGDTLLGCFYEFHYAPVLDEFKKAIDAGVGVQLIIDGKKNEFTDKKGKKHPSFPRTENLKSLKAAGITTANYALREARKNDIAHNKFIVLLKNGTTPAEVWTGSTNISLGAFSGQTNVGHWVRDAKVATQYQVYWNLLKPDPGGKEGDTRSASMAANKALQAAVGQLLQVPATPAAITKGSVAIFSPRAGLEVLDFYAQLVDGAGVCSCVTLAFGISKVFKDKLLNNTSQNGIVFMLLEKKDQPNPQSTQPFTPLTAHNNVYQAWGAFIDDPVYQWARETNARMLGLNTHVAYVHSKFLLADPLGKNPIVVSGSANFSDASTNDNDENMLLIQGDTRAADIYFTEFNRLWNHYYFRSVLEALHAKGKAPSDESLFLAENAGWTAKYAPGKLKAKRLAIYTGMDGAATL